MKFVKQMVNVIKQLLATLKDQGYDRIAISGGTSLNGEHYGGAFVYQYDPESKEMFFVGVPYNSQYHKTNDHESSHTKRPGETPAETAARELYEETSLKAKPEDLIPVFQYSINDNRPERTGQKHWKHFFMINIKKCSGELATFEGRNPIDGETAAPILMPVSLFAETLFGGHKQAFTKVVEKLSAERDYAYALMNMAN